MKGLLILIAFLFVYSAWSSVENFPVEYPVKNYQYITDFEYDREVRESDQYILLVFSSKDCLERTIIDRSCFLFEKKLDYFIPSFSPRIKVVGFNTYFENYQTTTYFQIHARPTVILLKNNSELKRMEATHLRPDVVNGRLDWTDELLKEVLETVRFIR
jgi:thioredoxin-related protein